MQHGVSSGYEVMINGKVCRIYKGSQDAKILYQEMKRFHPELARKLEFERTTQDWWRKIEAGKAPNNWIDALIVTMTAMLERKR